MSQCESCHAGCCRSFAVPLSGADIIGIEKRLKLTFWDFVCRWADPRGKIARGKVPHFHFADDPATPYVICLMHTDSPFRPGTTKCRFLIESPGDEEHPLGKARCGIYNARPGACRIFPTRLDAAGGLGIVCEVPEQVREDANPVYKLCARQWEPADLDAISAVQDLVVARYEFQFFTQVAERWNRSPQAWTVFPDFLRLVYSNRLQHESAIDDEPATVPFRSDATPLRVRRAA